MVTEEFRVGKYMITRDTEGAVIFWVRAKDPEGVEYWDRVNRWYPSSDEVENLTYEDYEDHDLGLCEALLEEFFLRSD